MNRAARLLPFLTWTMIVLLSLGLAGAFAMGFGAPLPQWAVIGAIGLGTVTMILVFAILICGGIALRANQSNGIQK